MYCILILIGFIFYYLCSAHGHPNVVRTFNISSDKPVESNEETNERKRKHSEDPTKKIEVLIASIVETFTKHQKKQIEYQERSLAHQKAMLKIEQDRFEREVDMRKTLHWEELKAKKWTAYYESMRFTDDASVMQTEKLKRELMELEGF